MKIRYQIIERGIKTLDTVVESRNIYSAMQSLLDVHGVVYNPDKLQNRRGWLNFYRGDDILYRVSSQFG